ncbi:NUDIX hydrolase [Saccharothrix australiensis]|uniref:8-oxo-dGTP diphosphatase n=1 Tax=Saccharothrix australiensis TaxID=2072 RepID=A0A495VWS1_9PSEU|nr:NUDIX domain-containing protein [Saccharothrix australiensis]RKT53822.1 8-oxo-dGTP diphosphatase [Saccharothrix australiensis]
MSRFARVLPAALAVVPGPDGAVTFVHQRKGPYAGHWLLPGGGVEVGETAEETARREVLEETGCRVGRLDLFAVYEFLGEWAQGPYHLVMFAFRADEPSTVPPGFTGHNVGGVRQVAPSAVDLHSTDLQILNDAGLTAFDHDRVQGALRADGITMAAHTVVGSLAVRSTAANGEEPTSHVLHDS